MKILRKLGIWMIGNLIVQYILGMTSNLFVSFPENGDAVIMWEFAWKQIPISLHIIVGVALLIFSIIILVIAIKNKLKNWTVAGTVGLISIFIAGFSGAQFIPTQSSVYSYLMSIFFIIAFVSYGWGILSN